MKRIPFRVERMAVDFTVEPFRAPGPCLRPMEISAQWCRVDTSYFTHNWETRGGRERLIPCRTGPKDLPTAHCPLLHSSCHTNFPTRETIGILQYEHFLVNCFVATLFVLFTFHECPYFLWETIGILWYEHFLVNCFITTSFVLFKLHKFPIFRVKQLETWIIVL